MTAPRRGARPQVVLVKFDTRRVEKISIQVTTQKIATSKDLAPLRGATQLKIPFPVVSADSDHRLLSCNPSGCAQVSQLYGESQNSRPRFLVNPCAAGWITGLGQFEKRRVKFAIFLSVLSSLHVVLSSLRVVLSSRTLFCRPRTLFCRRCTLRGRRCTLRLCRLMCGKALPFPRRCILEDSGEA